MDTRCRRSLHQWATQLNQPLEATDPELFDIIEKEKHRQRTNLVLIASEVRGLPGCGDSPLAVNLHLPPLRLSERSRPDHIPSFWTV